MITEFYKPTSCNEALELKKIYGASAYFFAGGTELNSLDFIKRNDTPKVYISIENLGFNRLLLKNGISIGAAVTIQELLSNSQTPQIIKEAASHIINRNIREMATIGGNIAANKSCSNLLPVLCSLAAELRIETDAGEKIVDVYDYCRKEDNQLIKDIYISADNLKKSCGIAKFTRTANDISFLTAAVSFSANEKKILKDLRIFIGGVDKHILRLIDVEKQFTDKPLPPKQEIEKIVSSVVSPIGDVRGSAEFKKYIAGVIVADCFYKANKSF